MTVDRTARWLDVLEYAPAALFGIVNVTPDSFSDGGEFFSVDAAVDRGVALADEGAEIIDIGGESTRPGSAPVSIHDQIERVIPVIKQLRKRLSAKSLISIDTTQAEVAADALEAGADIINDVSAGRDDPRMFATAVQFRAPIVLMHMLGSPKTMQESPQYADVVRDVLDFLEARSIAALSEGLSTDQLIFDPGIGFGKRKDDNLTLIANISRVVAAGVPVLVGASRKRFMGSVCRVAEPKDLLGATVASTAYLVQKGVRALRVHDVKENRQAVDVITALRPCTPKLGEFPTS